MKGRCVLVTMALTLGLPAASSARVSGGGRAATDCYAVWEGVTASSSECRDGDATCDDDGRADGVCTFGVNVCVAQTDMAECAAARVTDVRVPQLRRTGRYVSVPLELPTIPAQAPACGTAAVVRVPLRGRSRDKPSRALKLRMVAATDARKRDLDRLTLRCLPGTGGSQRCPDNPAGGPSELELMVEGGTDLDLGFVGLAHNIQFVAGTVFRMCLSDCDGGPDPVCSARGETGPVSINGTVFGPPLPLTVAATNCLVNRYTTPITGTTNVESGSIDLEFGLGTEVYVLSDCPECNGDGLGDTGRCTAGPDKGRVCRVEGTVIGANDRLLTLSSACRPEAKNGRPREIGIHLTVSTGVRRLDGSRPCDRQPEDDRCPGGGTCSARCTGSACVTERPDPVVDGATACVDTKGGISQLCCSTDTSKACFPTAGADGRVERSGRARAPSPLSPGAAYPRVADAVAVDTFCLPATGDNGIDAAVTGLPGPGAAIIPVRACWLREQGCATSPP